MKKAIALSAIFLLPALFMLAVVPAELDGAADTYVLGTLGVAKCRMSVIGLNHEANLDIGFSLHGNTPGARGAKIGMDACNDIYDAVTNACPTVIGNHDFDCQVVGQGPEFCGEEAAMECFM